jgi:hypothetical protein
VEQETGLDFFSALLDNEKTTLENETLTAGELNTFLFKGE